MATREQLIEDFADHKLATGEKFVNLINSMKVVQEPVEDPAASGTSLSFIASIEQNADGKITAMKKTLDLENAHELNPFKGWWKTGDTLPTSGFDGAYLYFKDTTQTPAVTTIYQWNGTTYVDTETEVDESNVQTFGSGQMVNAVAIDDSQLINPAANALAKAGDVMQLAAKLEGVTASEVKVNAVVGTNVTNGAYVSGETGLLVTPSSSASSYAYFELAIPQGTKSIRFTTGTKTSSSKIGYSIGYYDNGTYVPTRMFYFDVAETTPPSGIVEKTIEVLEDETTFMVTVASVSTYASITLNDFYCYLQSGKTVVDLINDLPHTLNEESYEDIDLSQYSNITTATILYYANVWDNTTYPYNVFKLIPVSPGRTFEVKANATYSSQITFLKSDTVEVGSTPDYAGDITNLTSISVGTTRRFTAPEDAVYMYVLVQQSYNTIEDRTPQYIRLIQPGYIQQSKIVNNLDSTDNTTVLSGALGPTLKPLVEAGKPINRISPLGGQKVQGANLYYADGEWRLGTGKSCTFVDIQGLGIKKIQVVSGNHTSHFGFVSDFIVPENGVAGLENTYASIIDNIYIVNANKSVDKDVPSEAKFIYFNISNTVENDGSRQTYVPKEVNILEQESNIEPIIPSWNDNYDYETYVEENLYDEYKSDTYTKQKFYKIDHNAEYKLLLYGTDGYGTSVYGITTYDSSYNTVRTLYPWGNGTSLNVNMDDLVFQENETYVKLMYYHTDSGAYGPTALGALMRKLKNDNWITTNNLIYCVSKIKSPVMPYNYQTAETTFPQTDEWSAWSFVMPYNYNRVLFTNKKFPICTFFHGSSGWVSPDNMGYASSAIIMSATKGKTIVGMLREAGYVVFDINGYGISKSSDEYSEHWGNPRAVSTVKKAYEVLVDRFNCRRGMAISGISMGGAIAKSYCMTYPADVVCVAMEAPSELGGICRFSGWTANPTIVAHAWGYENGTDMYADNDHTAFIGYSPLIAPNVIDENGFIKKIVQTDWNNRSDIYNNLDSFSCNFPVETKIWHGDADVNVPLEYSQWFVNTVRNANGNATLRLCPNCTHDLNNYPWVRQEIINYVDSKMKL